MKTCTKCKIEKSLSEFGKRGGKQAHLYNSWCKKCKSGHNAARLKERYHNEPGVKERVSEYSKKWSEENADRKSAARKAHYEANREVYIQRAKSWADENRITVRQTKRRHKMKKSGLELIGLFTEKEWLALCEEYGNKCLSCSRVDVTLVPDHVIPLSQGGLNEIGNIQPLCASCNSRKHVKTTDYRS